MPGIATFVVSKNYEQQYPANKCNGGIRMMEASRSWFEKDGAGKTSRNVSFVEKVVNELEVIYTG